ncbi:MAG: MarR family winged helix-turn-helix transcriptional regulator [Lachnospiraceae bacterium]
MKHKNTLGYEVKTLDNLFYRNMLSYETHQQHVDEVTLMHGWILGFLYDNVESNIFQKDIEQEFSIARSTVTCIVKLMEKKGYIKRESVASDARLKKLVLTDLGRKTHEEHISYIDVLEKRCKRNISLEELEVFLKVVSKLKRNLEEDIVCNKKINSSSEDNCEKQ